MILYTYRVRMINLRFYVQTCFVFFLGLGETYVLLAKHHLSQGFNGRAKLNCQDALQCLTRYMYLIHLLMNSNFV